MNLNLLLNNMNQDINYHLNSFEINSMPSFSAKQSHIKKI